MKQFDALRAAVEANVAALRRPEGVGYPDGRARCLIIADDLERALMQDDMSAPGSA